MSPNILLFHCHDLGRHLGCYGVDSVVSPNIDRFAEDGVRFSNCFCVAPQCSPSRATMFTGGYPHSNGVMGLSHDSFGWDLHPDELHLAKHLREFGYRTAIVGIMHETSSSAQEWGYEHCEVLDAVDASAEVVCNSAISLLSSFAESRDRPFFMSVGCYEPHRIVSGRESDKKFVGFNAEAHVEDYSRGTYIPSYLTRDEGTRQEMEELQGAIKYVDFHFGRLLTQIERLKLSHDTVIIFTTDHGIAMPRAKCTCYDPGIEIALIVRWPSKSGWTGGMVIDQLLSNLDLFPTLCDVSGMEVPPNVQGRSWAPLLNGQRYSENEFVFPELTHHDYYDPIRAVRTKEFKLLAFFSSAPSFMPPNQSWQPRSSPSVPSCPALTYHPDFELYDLVADPLERVSVFEDDRYSDVKENLMGVLFEHLKRTQDPILLGAVTPPIHRRVMERMQSSSRVS